ncbi:MAG: lipopolysaccharide exporter [Alphaproteobacteria bacterium]|nr:lipopolysaccharide exporter [Alphaproteobacteria bacterium]
MSQQPSDMDRGLLEQKEVNIRVAIAQGGLWIFLGRWSIRGIGILSTVILARLLVPEDFGLVAICLLVVGLAQTIGDEGQELTVIRRQNLDRAYMDSAWTASIITGIVLGAGVLAAAPIAAAYFEEPRAEFLIQILSIRVFMMGFYNIGLALNRRDFNFGKDFTYIVLQKIFPAIITVLLAWYLRNYWALVIGAVAGYAVTICASYMLSAYRPRLGIIHIREVWRFSGWLMLQRLAHFFSSRIDQFFVPLAGNTVPLGYYHVGSELARMPVGELFMPIDRVLAPAYARQVDQPVDLARTFIYTLSVAAIVCLPAGIGFALVAGDFVHAIYGEKWIPMAPVVQILAVSSISVALISTVTTLLNILGRSRLSAGLICLQALLLLGGLFLSQNHLDTISEVAWVRLITVSLALPVALICIRIIVPVRFLDMLNVFWRPVIAVAVMALTLTYLLPPGMDLPGAARLILRTIAGGLVYAAVLNLLWLVCGKPPGVENAFWQFVSNRLDRNTTQTG